MKLKLLAAACSLALGGQAYALSPSVTAGASTVNIYASGSSAASRVLNQVLGGPVSGVNQCVPGTADTYLFSGDTSNVIGISCTLNSGVPGLGNQNVFFNYNSQNGSGYGIYSIAKETIPSSGALNTALAGTLQRPYLSGVSTSCNSGVSVAGNPGLTYTCTATTNQWPDVGITDTEPTLHNNAVDTPPQITSANIPPVTDAESGQLNSAAAFQQVFGIAVSQALYNDLQSMQVALGLIPSGGVPSLSKSAIANYLSGTFQSPSTGFGWQPLFAASPLGTPALAGGPVTICTRVPGSGTKSGANTFFLNNPCGGGNNLLAPATASQSVAGTFVVNEGSSTGDVKNCLTAAGTGAYAIGIIGHDNATGANSQYVAIDGVVPSRENARTGLYDWFVESWIQWNNNYLTIKPVPSGVTAGNVTDFLSNFRTAAGSPDVMNTFSSAQQDGVLAIPDGVNLIFNDPSNANNKKFVARATKLGNSCLPSLWGS